MLRILLQYDSWAVNATPKVAYIGHKSSELESTAQKLAKESIAKGKMVRLTEATGFVERRVKFHDPEAAAELAKVEKDQAAERTAELVKTVAAAEKQLAAAKKALESAKVQAAPAPSKETTP